MAKRMMYGISFIPEILNNNIVMLRASHIVEGNLCENTLYDKYDDGYRPISFSLKTEDYKNTYGLGVTEDELIEYVKRFTDIPKVPIDRCAKTYLSCIKQYVFFLEKRQDEVLCNAMALPTKQMFPI